VLLPLLLLLLSAACAAAVAYGPDPNWAQYPHGLQLILFSRRFEWPLVAIALIFCIFIIALVIAGKRRAWWLIGLAPMLAVLGHQFAANPGNAFLVNVDPIFVSADHASFLSGDDWVVGMIDGSDALAFPFSSLYSQPLVVRELQTRPMLLMWSPFANCASAYTIDRSIQTNEIEIVSMPANAMLVYNSRDGQFINGITGLMPDGRPPSGFGSKIPTIKTTWARWLGAHPDTLVLSPPTGGGEAPTRAVLPYFPMPPGSTDPETEATVALIGNPPVAAISDSDLSSGAVNFSGPDILIVRDPRTDAIQVFDRHVDEDLAPVFSHRAFRKFPNAMMIDSDSRSAWTTDGIALDGALKGKKLRRLPVEDGVYWSVARYWFKNLPLVSPIVEAR
jgi:Protein of unknown function (DUF3179)